MGRSLGGCGEQRELHNYTYTKLLVYIVKHNFHHRYNGVYVLVDVARDVFLRNLILQIIVSIIFPLVFVFRLPLQLHNSTEYCVLVLVPTRNYGKHPPPDVALLFGDFTLALADGVSMTRSRPAPSSATLVRTSAEGLEALAFFPPNEKVNAVFVTDFFDRDFLGWPGTAWNARFVFWRHAPEFSELVFVVVAPYILAWWLLMRVFRSYVRPVRGLFVFRAVGRVVLEYAKTGRVAPGRRVVMPAEVEARLRRELQRGGANATNTSVPRDEGAHRALETSSSDSDGDVGRGSSQPPPLSLTGLNSHSRAARAALRARTREMDPLRFSLRTDFARREKRRGGKRGKRGAMRPHRKPLEGIPEDEAVLSGGGATASGPRRLSWRLCGDSI